MSFFFVLMNNVFLQPMVENVAASSVANSPRMLDIVNSLVDLGVFLCIGVGLVAIMYGTMLKSTAM